MWLSFHERLLTADNLAKREIHITSPCLLWRVNSKIIIHIFLLWPFTLELWALEKNRLALSSWSFSIDYFGVIGGYQISHTMKLIGGMLSMQSYEQFDTSEIKGLFKQNLLLWSSRVKSRLWWLFGNLISHYINVAIRHTLLFFFTLTFFVVLLLPLSFTPQPPIPLLLL